MGAKQKALGRDGLQPESQLPDVEEHTKHVGANFLCSGSLLNPFSFRLSCSHPCALKRYTNNYKERAKEAEEMNSVVQSHPSKM